jgi:predicted unusual protein kinase regulating ubiquinone biosynthesis (AarF/ABC1/UbiB family)
MSTARGQTSRPDAAPQPTEPQADHPPGDLLSTLHRLSTLSDLTTDTVLFTSMAGARPCALAADAFAWIERELDAPLDTVFARLDTWANAGSLGQVHRGLLLDDRQVAVKIRYPSSTTANEDLASFLRVELDYRLEANVLARIRHRTRGLDGVLTPTPIGDLTTETMLIMSWVPGETFAVTREWSLDARTQAARTLLQFFLRGWLVWGEIYGDPHPAHLRFLRNGTTVSVGFVDFGCMRPITSDARNGLVRLFQTRGELDQTATAEIFTHLGFDSRDLEPVTASLSELVRRAFDPFRRPGTQASDHWPVFEQIVDQLGPSRRGRMAGDPPIEFIPLARSFHGLAHYLRALSAPLDLRQELDAILADAHA